MISCIASCDVNEKGERLSRKIIQLSLEIDDKKKNIQLLKETIARTKDETIKAIEMEEENLRKQLEAKKEISRREHESTMQKCNVLVEEKKRLAGNLSLVCEERKIAENDAFESIRQTRNKYKANAEELHKNWKEDQDNRTAKWEEKKKREIRGLTIKSLEPEIAKILDEHRYQCNELSRTYEEEKAAINARAKTELDRRIFAYNLDISKRHNHELRTYREEMNETINRIRNDNLSNLRKARKEMENERDELRRNLANELRTLSQSHADEIKNLIKSGRENINYNKSLWSERENAIEKSLHDKLNIVQSNFNTKHAEWESAIERNLKQERLEKLSKATSELEMKRNLTIKDIVRDFHLNETRLHEQINSSNAETLRQMDISHRNVLAESRQRELNLLKNISNLEQQVEKIEIEIATLNKNVENSNHQVETTSNEISALEEKFESMKVKLDERTRDLDTDHKSKMLELSSSKACLQSQVSGFENDIIELKRENEDSLERLYSTHKDNLNKLDSFVKSEMVTKEDNYQQLLLQIQEEETRLEHLDRLMKEYT